MANYNTFKIFNISIIQQFNYMIKKLMIDKYIMKLLIKIDRNEQ